MCNFEVLAYCLIPSSAMVLFVVSTWFVMSEVFTVFAGWNGAGIKLLSRHFGHRSDGMT